MEKLINKYNIYKWHHRDEIEWSVLSIDEKTYDVTLSKVAHEEEPFVKSKNKQKLKIIEFYQFIFAPKYKVFEVFEIYDMGVCDIYKKQPKEIIKYLEEQI